MCASTGGGARFKTIECEKKSISIRSDSKKWRLLGKWRMCCQPKLIKWGFYPQLAQRCELLWNNSPLRQMLLVIDAVKFPEWEIAQVSLIKGDQRSCEHCGGFDPRQGFA